MFDAPLGSQPVDRDEYEARRDELRPRLLNAQFSLEESVDSCLIVLAGNDRDGCDELYDFFHEWLDPRELRSHVFLRPSGSEAARPEMWRYWSAVPPRGRIGVLLGGWPVRAIVESVEGLGDENWERHVREATSFERLLVASGVRLIKIWCHRSKEELEARYNKVQRDPELRWGLEHEDHWIREHYDEVEQTGRRWIEATSPKFAPWTVVSGEKDRSRDIAVAETILAALEAEAPARPTPSEPDGVVIPTTLQQTELSPTLPRDEYKTRIDAAQAEWGKQARLARDEERGCLLVFEGWDAAGKGGAIRRLTRPLPARGYRVVRIGAPDSRELSFPYLWRFWTEVPRSGVVWICDRSWYGRVLVERVEGFADPPDWRRAYDEINDFEAQFADRGWTVAKFWLHIDSEEQARRFEARKNTPYKRHKITDEDWRNRAKWDQYVEAVDEMIHRTSTPHAPWTVVATNDKRRARVQVIEKVLERMDGGG